MSKDRDWLRTLVTNLMQHAAGSKNDDGKVHDPDHQACSKYAELLLKMLPAVSGKQTGGSEAAERVRKQLELERSMGKPDTEDP